MNDPYAELAELVREMLRDGESAEEIAAFVHLLSENLREEEAEGD